MVRLKPVPAFMALLVLLAVGFGAYPVEAQEDPVYERVMRERKLRVFAIQYPPQSYREQTGEEWRGFDADIYRYISKRLGVELEVVWTSIAGMIPTLSSGRADAGIALFRTPEREKVIDYTNPYKWIAEHIIVHSDNKEITTMDTLKGKVLGVPRGTASELAARNIHEAGYVREVRVYDTADAMILDLRAKRVDAIIYQTLGFQWIQRQDPELRARLAFEVEPKYFGRTVRSPSALTVFKGASKLADAFNTILVEMRENGEMARIFARYGITEPSVWTPPQ